MADLTVGQLRELLEAYDEDLPVRLAHQPSYPLQYHISDEVREWQGVVYIIERDQVYDRPYLPKWLLNGGEEPCATCESSRRHVVADVTHDGETNPICQSCLDSLTEEDYAEGIKVVPR